MFTRKVLWEMIVNLIIVIFEDDPSEKDDILDKRVTDFMVRVGVQCQLESPFLLIFNNGCRKVVGGISFQEKGTRKDKTLQIYLQS